MKLAFIENLKARRRNLGLTQQQVADRLGMRQSSYAEIESGRRAPALPLLYRLAKALECTASDLLNENLVSVA